MSFFSAPLNFKRNLHCPSSNVIFTCPAFSSEVCEPKLTMCITKGGAPECRLVICILESVLVTLNLLSSLYLVSAKLGGSPELDLLGCKIDRNTVISQMVVMRDIDVCVYSIFKIY